MTIILLTSFLTGCATAPKPKTVGEIVGSAVDTSISWASAGVQKLMKK